MQRLYCLLTSALAPALHAAEDGRSGFQTVRNMTPGVTEVSRSIYDIHMLVLWICVAIGVLVFGFMFYVLWAHRRSRHPRPAQFHENHLVEIVWTAIPVLILIALAVPATRSIVELYDADNAELSIQVTGLQWKWQYDYLVQGEPGDATVRLLSELATPQEQTDNKKPKGQFYLQEVTQPLVVPTNTKIRFILTASDVIHSWWVPELGIKRDAIPGLTTEAWARIEQPGIYRGACAELCGKGHAFMPVVVHAMEPAEYEAWMQGRREQARALAAAARQHFEMDELMSRGRRVYQRSCAVCHGSEGQGLAGIYPAMAGSPIVEGPLEQHLDIVINGKTGTAMAAFGEQLDAIDLAAVITYQRNAWGADGGDEVQPLDIIRHRQ